MAASVQRRLLLRGYRQAIGSRLHLFAMGMGRRDQRFNLFL
jgi:hypothetical protein